MAEPLALPGDASTAALSLQHSFIESRDFYGGTVLATSDGTEENLVWLRSYHPGARIECVSRSEFLEAVNARFGPHLADHASHDLRRRLPSLSAHFTATENQVSALLVFAVAVVGFTVSFPQTALSLLVIVTSLAFLLGTVFRGALAVSGDTKESEPYGQRLENDLLPLYTLLIPLYREANVIPQLARALLRLDYPHDKLQILLIVEADDAETIAAARDLERRGPFEVIVVPSGKPRTKPRACNYALNFARGALTVIYDAEDRPERDQLQKAASAFRTLPPNVACLQARLSFYNADNVLTRLFTIDYLIWFCSLLPGLDRLKVPMPLGGTSNHFRTEILRKLGGWDPFNVTEDADLGVRIAQLRGRVRMLDSTTYEEATSSVPAWLKQRSRWMKGYMHSASEI